MSITNYPPRDAANEREMLRANPALSLASLSHYGWAGRRDLRVGARVLVVSVGNGDDLVYLAEQARGTAIEIVAVDPSPDAIRLSKARLTARGLSNVVHRECALMDLPRQNLGSFDVIVCNHVLDGIENPALVLESLRELLNADGLMALSLHAAYGTMVLQVVQQLMGHLVTEDMPRALQIEVAREFLKELPAGHWLGHHAGDFIAQLNLPDGSGIDALMLPKTREYFSVLDIYQLLDACGMACVAFVGPMADQYRVRTHTQAPEILALTDSRLDYEQHVIADAMTGSLRAHVFYAALEEKLPAAAGEGMLVTEAPAGDAPEAFLRHESIPFYVSDEALQQRLKNFSPITHQ